MHLIPLVLTVCCVYCHLKRDECLCLRSWHPLFLHLLLHLWHPVTARASRGRCPAGCRVARRLEYRCMADRYHNHTSPLLSLTSWIKHLPSCPWITHPPTPQKRNLAGGRLLEVSLRSNVRAPRDDTQHLRSPKLFLSQASPNIPDLFDSAVSQDDNSEGHSSEVRFHPKIICR